MFKIQGIDINKIKVSEEKLYSKPNSAYKHYILYDNDVEIISLFIKIPEVIGTYYTFHTGKSMNFRCDDDELLKKYEEIFDNVINKIDK